MIYNFSVSVATTNTATAPLKTTHKLTHGIIHKLDIVFPPGCLGLVGIAIFNGLHQLWPTNPTEYFISDDETISFREHYELIEEPFELYSVGYTMDDTYDHTIVLRIGILPVYILAPWLQSYDERIRAALGEE